MYYIFILLLVLSVTNSCKRSSEKICTRCKHYFPEYLAEKFIISHRCKLFLEDKSVIREFFDKKSDNMEDYHLYDEYQHCLISRKYDSLCGPDGKFFEKK